MKNQNWNMPDLLHLDFLIWKNGFYENHSGTIIGIVFLQVFLLYLNYLPCLLYLNYLPFFCNFIKLFKTTNNECQKDNLKSKYFFIYLKYTLKIWSTAWTRIWNLTSYLGHNFQKIRMLIYAIYCRWLELHGVLLPQLRAVFTVLFKTSLNLHAPLDGAVLWYL